MNAAKAIQFLATLPPDTEVTVSVVEIRHTLDDAASAIASAVTRLNHFGPYGQGVDQNDR